MKKSVIIIFILSLIFISLGLILYFNNSKNNNADEVDKNELSSNKKDEVVYDETSLNSYWKLKETSDEFIITLSGYECETRSYTDYDKFYNLCSNQIVFSKKDYKQVYVAKYGVDGNSMGQSALILIDVSNNVKLLDIYELWVNSDIKFIDLYSGGDAKEVISINQNTEEYPFYEESNETIGTYGYEMFIITSSGNHIRIDKTIRELEDKIRN